MITPKKPNISIIGAGISGCFMAILLAKRGYKVDIYERSAKEEIIANASRRSFNLTFFGYGVDALKKAGVWMTLEPNLLKLRGSMTQITKDSKPIYAPLDQEKMPYYCVKRSDLVRILLEQAESYSEVTIHYEKEIIKINREDKTVLFHNAKSQKSEKLPYDIILGADGVNSKVRLFLQQGQKTDHTQEYAAWSYKQLAFTQKDVNRLKLEDNVAYTWTRKLASILDFPNKDGSAVAMFVLPRDAEHGFASLKSPYSIEKLISEEFPGLVPVLSAIVKSILENPEGLFVTVHTEPWFYKDSIAIIGDAAHGFLPFFGQGMSAAFGDCLEIVKLLDQKNDSWKGIFTLYEQSRKKHMDALGELSKEGFSRYQRSKKADYTAVYEKFELILHKIFPKQILPPLFALIADDPDHTADHTQRYNKQRKIAGFFGIPLLVRVTTAIIAVEASSLDILHKLRRQKIAS